MPRFDFPSFLSHNKTHRITHFFSVPPIYLLIANHPTATTHFTHLELAVSGAAPLGKHLQHAASLKLGPRCFISQTWGLSETTGSATLLPLHMRDTTGSVSPLLPNMRARIVDDADADVAPGCTGEVLVQGPVVTRGYFRNADADAQAFTRDGWFRTGDVGVFRAGLLYVVDRKKELIKYKGLQVAPAELEAVLLQNPGVVDAAVIGVGVDGGTNEVPRAYVVAAAGGGGGGGGERVAAGEIVKWVKERVAGHKQIRGGVVFLDEIPKSPSGKILRKELRVLAEREQGAKL